MGSTDKTPHLALPLFTDSDKPSFRGDINDLSIKVDDHALTTITTLDALGSSVADATANVDGAMEAVVNLSNVAARKTELAALDESVDTRLATVTDTTNTIADTLTTAVSDLAGDVPGLAFAERYFGGRTEFVVVGTSNVASSSVITETKWPTFLAESMGLSVRNFAQDSSSIASGGFMSQLQAAANSPAFNNGDVGLVVISDLANDTRNGTGVAVALQQCIAYAKSTFPNARIVVHGFVWHANWRDHATATVEWERRVKNVETEARNVCARAGVEYISRSYSWLTAKTDLFLADAIHPTSAGNRLVADYIESHLLGSDIFTTLYGDLFVLGNAAAYADGCRYYMDSEWNVHVQGSVRAAGDWSVDGAGVGTKFAVLGGIAPSSEVRGTAVIDGLSDSFAHIVVQSGKTQPGLICQTPLPANSVIWLDLSWNISI